MRRILFSFLICLVAVVTSDIFSPVFAQSAGATTSNITGTVIDEQGAIIPAVNVTARNLQTNFTRETLSGEDGSFLISQLPPGSYELTVTAEGFSTKTSRLDLVLGTTTLLNFTMNIGGNSEVVEVKAESTVNTGKTESSTNNDTARIENLPINKRDYMEFSLTAARVVKDGLPLQGAIATSGLSFNGQSARQNNITIDGLDNNDPVSGSVRATFSQDAVQEFQVVSDSYSAEFGRAIGGVVNIVTKGGSNEYHGNLFFFDRNDAISARDVFSPFKPPFQQYQFGASVGGPVKRDRAFFFTSFERLSVKQNNFVTISDESVAAANRVGFPLRNGPLPFSLDTSTFLARLDGRLSATDTFSVRYNFGGTYNGNFEPFGGLIGETNAGIQRLDDSSFVATNTYISAGLNLLNETRFLYGRRKQDVFSFVPGPQINLVGPEGLLFFGRSTFAPQGRDQTIYQIIDNISLTRGRNQIKFGGDFLYNNSPRDKSNLQFFGEGLGVFLPINFATALGNPDFPSFSGLQAFDPSLRTAEQRAFLTMLAGVLPGAAPGFPKNLPLADFSLPTAYVQLFSDTRVTFREKFFSAFVQNDIRLRPNLLIKAGVRYDIIRLDAFPQTNGNISPRFAIAYRPERLPKLSVHGVYGIFFGTLPVSFAAAINNTTAPNRLLVIPFPFSIIPFSLPEHHFPAGADTPPGVPVIPQLIPLFRIQKDMRNGYTQQTDVGFDYAIGNNIISASYIFVRGIKIYALRNVNTIVRPIPGDPLGSAITGRVNPALGEFMEFESSFDSYYHAFTISFNRRFTNRFGLLAHYTYSKAIDNAIDFRVDIVESENPEIPNTDRGLSLQDVRGRFVLSGLWDLTYTKNPFLRDFRLSTIVNMSTGRAYNPLAGVDLNLNGDNPPGDRPAGLARNIGILPGFATVDMRLTRTVSIGERYRIQGFFEIFNMFNRVNISTINRIFPPDAQGNFNLPPRQGSRLSAPPDRYLNAFPPRQLQLGFKLTF